MRIQYIIILSVAVSIAFSYASHRGNAVENLYARLGLHDANDRASIEEAVLLYNKVSASFYNTAGDDVRRGLDEIPASPLLKRRLVKDINMLKGDGLLMVFDRDSLDIGRVYFIDRDFAVAEADEVWAVALQQIETRELVFNVKAVEVRARYQLVRVKGRWIVNEADVYPKGDTVPGVESGPVL